MNRNIERYRSPLFSPFLGIEPFSPFPDRKGLLDNMFDTGFSFAGLSDLLDSDFGVKVVDKEDHKEYQFGLPGIKKENIDVDISGNILSIKVSQKEEETIRSYSSKVTLAPDLDLSQASAESTNGLLTVSFPYIKKNAFKIEVTSGDKEEGAIPVSSSDENPAKEVESAEDTGTSVSSLSLSQNEDKKSKDYQI